MSKEEFEREVAETVAALPQDMPEDTLNRMRNVGSLGRNVIMYRSGYVFDPIGDRNVRMAECTCTACGRKFWLEQVSNKTVTACCHQAYGMPYDAISVIDPVDNREKKSYETMLCPECGTGCSLVHVGRFRSIYTIGKEDVVTVHEVRGHLAILSWMLEKYVDKEGKTGVIFTRHEGVIVIAGKPIRVAGTIKYLSTLSVLPRWTARKRYTEEIGKLPIDHVSDFDPDLIQRTDSENSALWEYMFTGRNNVQPGGYIRIWTKWPQVENMVRQGYVRFIDQMMDECRKTTGYGYYCFDTDATKRYLNWKEVKPHRMLGVRKEDTWIAKEYPIEIFEMFRRMQERGIRFGERELDIMKVLRPYNCHELWKEPFHGYEVPPVRMLHYLDRQRQRPGGEIVRVDILRDYWNMVCEVYKRMEPGMLWPKDLIAAHDNLRKQIKHKEEVALLEKFREQVKQREWLAWQDDELGLMIRPAASQEELITEGTMLQHCVATYAKQVAEGRTTILFIRRIEAPDTPFYTLEWRNDEVQQNRGLRNCARTEEVRQFEDEWVKHIREMEAKNGFTGKKNKSGTCA